MEPLQEVLDLRVEALDWVDSCPINIQFLLPQMRDPSAFDASDCMLTVRTEDFGRFGINGANM